MTTTAARLLASAQGSDLAGIGASLVGLSLAMLSFGIVCWQMKESRGKPVRAVMHRAGRRITLAGAVLLVASIVLVIIGR